MLVNWGTALAGALLVGATGVLGAAPPTGDPGPPVLDTPTSTPTDTGGEDVSTISDLVTLQLRRDGQLDVTEKIVAPPGKKLTRHVPLRFDVGDRTQRLFTVKDATVVGAVGGAQVTGDQLVITVTGTTTVKYTVDGAVVALGDHEQVRWQAVSGWDTAFTVVGASFAGPVQPQRNDCLAGPVGSTTKCEQVGVDESSVVRATQHKLKAGERLDLAVQLPGNAVPANAATTTTSAFAAAFALNPATGIGLVGLSVLLLVGVALLWLLRGRDAKVLHGDVAPVDVLYADDAGRVAFASPDGVLPGQIGTVVDEHVDVVDVTATVVDLAVRNYLWVQELAEQDWRLYRRNPADESLTAYERAVYQAILPGGREQVLLSELRGGVALDAVRDAMYADVVARQWFVRRPDTERSRWWWTGLGVLGVGVVLTVVLAVVSGYALLGLAVVIAGGALAIGSRWMPSRTRRGSALLVQVRGLVNYLRDVRPEHIPDADREMVFSRSLPYAVVLGETQAWLTTFAGLDSAADGTPGLYWFGEAETTPDLARFASRFPAFVSALDSVLAKAGALRSQG